MTIQVEDINKAVVFEIISAMGEDGKDALLTADDLLAVMAVPVTQFDFTYSKGNNLKELMFSVEKFLKSSKLKTNNYSKAGLQAKFEELWLPSLSLEEKQNLISEYRIVEGFDANGNAIFNQKNFEAWKNIFDKGQIPRLEYKVPQFSKKSKAVELIDNRPFIFYKEEEKDGYLCAPLDISTDLWEKIIRDSSYDIKRMLQCYRQLEIPNKRIKLKKMEVLFGIKLKVFTACIIALGRRAQKMLNFAVLDSEDESIRRYWSTPMNRGRFEEDQWVWEPRRELMEAAERVLSEENYPEIPEIIAGRKHLNE